MGRQAGGPAAVRKLSSAAHLFSPAVRSGAEGSADPHGACAALLSLGLRPYLHRSAMWRDWRRKPVKPWRQPPGPSSELLSSMAQELGSKTDLQFNWEMG